MVLSVVMKSLRTDNVYTVSFPDTIFIYSYINRLIQYCSEKPKVYLKYPLTCKLCIYCILALYNNKALPACNRLSIFLSILLCLHYANVNIIIKKTKYYLIEPQACSLFIMLVCGVYRLKCTMVQCWFNLRSWPAKLFF